MIYEELLLASVPLRPLTEGEKGLQTLEDPDCPPTEVFDTGILRTCRSVHVDALPVLYRVNTFRYELSLRGLSLSQHSLHLDSMRHISIACMDILQPFYQTLGSNRIDEIIAGYLTDIKHECSGLKTLEIEMSPWLGMQRGSLSFPALLVGKGAAYGALKALRPRLDLLTVKCMCQNHVLDKDCQEVKA